MEAGASDAEQRALRGGLRTLWHDSLLDALYTLWWIGDRQYDHYVDDVDHDHARAVAKFERGCVSSSLVFDSRVLGVHVAAGPGKYRNAGLPDGSDASAATPTFGGPPTPATLAMARK